MRLRVKRVELDHFQVESRRGSQVGPDPRDPSGGPVPDDGGDERSGGGQIVVGCSVPSCGGVTLRAEEKKLAQRLQPGRRRLVLSVARFLELLDGLVERGVCLLWLVPVHERMEQSPRRGRRRDSRSPSFLLEEAQCFGHLLGGARGAEIRLGELILPVVERAREAVNFRGVHEAPLFPPLCGQQVIPRRRQRSIAHRTAEQAGGFFLLPGKGQPHLSQGLHDERFGVERDPSASRSTSRSGIRFSSRRTAAFARTQVDSCGWASRSAVVGRQKPDRMRVVTRQRELSESREGMVRKLAAQPLQGRNRCRAVVGE